MIDEYDIEIAARALVDYINEYVGTTDDWPCQISFDDDDEADKFLRLYNRLVDVLND